MGILAGQRRLAQHVERVSILAIVAALGALHRLRDRATHDELVAHDLHGLAHGATDDGLSGPGNQLAHEAPRMLHGLLIQLDHSPREHQTPGRSIDEHRIARTHVLPPVPGQQLVRDQLVGSVAVGDTEQRLCETHEDDALLG